MAAPQGKQEEANDPPSIPQVQDEPQDAAGPVVHRRPEKDENRGGYECEFIHPPPTYVQTECSICLLVLRSPHIASCCSHNFCKECIERVQKVGKCCPLCNKDNFILTYNRDKDVSLQQTEVYCPHRKMGCEWRGKMEMLDTHLNVNPKLDKQLEGCAFVEVQCFNDGCGLYYQRRCIVEHQCRVCPLRVFSCEHCHEYESTYHDVTTNHWPVCKCYPLPCPHECRQETIQRHNLEQHLKEECPLQEVECEFKYAGCEAKLPRKDMPDHLMKNSIRHMTLLARQNQELMRKLHEKDEQLRQVMEESQRVRSTVDDNRREMEETIACLKDELRTKLAERDEQIREQQAVAAEVATLKKQLGDVAHKQEATDRSLKKFQDSTAPAAEVVTLENQPGDLGQKQDVVTTSLENPHQTAPVRLVMTNYERHQWDDDSWYSDGFYTHPQGYKMCLKVYANGHVGTHVSCYICLMDGEFDNHLKWPFRGYVTITMLNQREDNNHRTKTIGFHDQTPDKHAARVTIAGKPTKGLGKHHFIPLSELGYNLATNCQYLMNDCLYFRLKFELR